MASPGDELLTFCFPIEMESGGADASWPRVVLLSEVGQHNPHNLAVAQRLLPVGVETPGSTADGSELVRLMHEYARENSVSLSEALVAVAWQDPRLWERHSEAVMREAPGERNVIPID